MAGTFTTPGKPSESGNPAYVGTTNVSRSPHAAPSTTMCGVPDKGSKTVSNASGKPSQAGQGSKV